MMFFPSWSWGEEAEAGRLWAASGGNDPAVGAAAESLQSSQGGRGEWGDQEEGRTSSTNSKLS